jgi:hypothetical protein
VSVSSSNYYLPLRVARPTWQDPCNLLSLTEWLALAYCRPLSDPGLTAPLSNLNRLRLSPLRLAGPGCRRGQTHWHDDSRQLDSFKFKWLDCSCSSRVRGTGWPMPLQASSRPTPSRRARTRRRQLPAWLGESGILRIVQWRTRTRMPLAVGVSACPPLSLRLPVYARICKYMQVYASICMYMHVCVGEVGRKRLSVKSMYVHVYARICTYMNVYESMMV